MRHLIVGFGEVGQGLATVLAADGPVFTDDQDRGRSTWNAEPVDWVHLCVPYGEWFDEVVDRYRAVGKVVVHSTVPFGTCDRLGIGHSPIRGVHPHLADGIRTFVKYCGGAHAACLAQVFEGIGIRTRVFPDARTTEAIKLWDTTQYGRQIQLEQEIHAWCVAHAVDPDAVYREANRSYNDGYVQLGRPEVVRPWLRHVEGPIGGHCVLPNARLLGVPLG